jgi:hypothetical protein
MNVTIPFFKSGILYRTFSHPTVEKILRFSELEKGWNYGEGELFATDAIKAALEFHREVIFNGHSSTDAFPGLDGEIQITIYEGEHYFAFERERSGTWIFTHEKNNEEVESHTELSFENAKEKLKSINLASIQSMLCNVSGYYREETIGTKDADYSMIWRLNQGKTESPCSV